MDAWVYWMIAAVVLAAIELAVFTIFIFGPLAVAALVTAIAAALGASTEVQIIIFIVLGLCSMLALYPLAKRYRKGDPEFANNVDALIGKEARTLERISDESLGLIRFDNANWTARTAEGVDPIPPDTAVTVVSIAGATAIVKPLAPTDSDNK